MTSDAYRTLQSDYYSAKILGKGSMTTAIDQLKALMDDPDEKATMQVRYDQLISLAQMLGSDFPNRDFTGSVELDALRRLFETG
jgi:hypothetical protein